MSPGRDGTTRRTNNRTVLLPVRLIVTGVVVATLVHRGQRCPVLTWASRGPGRRPDRRGAPGALVSYPVHILPVIPYYLALQYLSGFDVAAHPPVVAVAARTTTTTATAAAGWCGEKTYWMCGMPFLSETWATDENVGAARFV
jgi:hypothetical protein